VTKHTIGMLKEKESHWESDLLQQCRWVVILEEVGAIFALVEQQMLVLHFSPFFSSSW